MLANHPAIARACLVGLLFILAWQAGSALPALQRYRDLKIYTTSAPGKENPAKITAVTQFLNEGTKTLRISARLAANRAIGFRGATFTGRIAPGKSGNWTWSLTPPEGMPPAVLTGEIDLNGRRERDLLIAVQGADPPGKASKWVEPIAERARVVATYAPRTQQSILAEMREIDRRRPQPALALAEAGKSEYAIVIEALPAPQAGQDPLAGWQAMRELTDPQQELVMAVSDLQRCLQLQSGAVLPILTKQAGPAIVLRQADPGEAAKDLRDAYRLKTEGRDVIIEANNLDGLQRHLRAADRSP